MFYVIEASAKGIGNDIKKARLIASFLKKID